MNINLRNKKPPIYNRKYQISNELADLDPIIAKILSARGVTKEEHFCYRLKSLAPISSLENINDAVDLLIKHKEHKIVVVGDFDVDGATSVALLLRCLKDFGFNNLDYIVPNRFDDGYGLTIGVVNEAARLEPKLIITVDNGISSLKGVDKARNLGIEVLVTDHHLPGDELPKANVILNPNLKESTFVSPNLAGVGVAFYLLAGLGRVLESQGLKNAARTPLRYLDLVALGTVADVVKLDFNNRVLVYQGLQAIKKKSCVVGILALLEKSGKDYKKITSADLGFSIGPKINAAGRLDDISTGIECLITDDINTAKKYTDNLLKTNEKRRNIEAKMHQEAFDYINQIDNKNMPSCLCIYNKNWHQGVVGLVASRLKEYCNRPVIAFADDNDGILKGSARSIHGVHIRDLLEAISANHFGLIEKFGGHSMAAGLSLKMENFAEFKLYASKYLQKLYPSADFSGAIYTDGEISPEKLNLEFAKMIQKFGPWGAGFEIPLFHGKFHLLDQRVVGENHLKMQVKPIKGETQIDAIAFNQERIISRDPLELIYRLEVNEFRGEVTEQLLVENIYSN